MTALVSVVSQLMLKPAGMRMRRSFKSVIVGVPLSITVIALMAVAASLTLNTWSLAE